MDEFYSSDQTFRSVAGQEKNSHVLVFLFFCGLWIMIIFVTYIPASNK